MDPVDGYALVVGAASGIGYECALTFAERGARGVAFADKNRAGAEQAAEAASKLAASTPGFKALVLQVDVVDRESVKAMTAATVDAFGRIDYAVNSAGLPRQYATATPGISDEELDLLHNVNAKGTLHCLQEQIAVMAKQEPRYVSGRNGQRSIGPGSIVNITSLSAFVPAPGSLAYTASKFQARAIIKTAALENRQSGLRINEVCPGYTDTPMFRDSAERNPQIHALIAKYMPLGRAALPEEIASLVHFLSSPGASFVNGQSWIADSGVSINMPM